MNSETLYNSVKSTILLTQPCPDGSPKMACPSCLAEAVVKRLVARGLVEEKSSD